MSKRLSTIACLMTVLFIPVFSLANDKSQTQDEPKSLWNKGILINGKGVYSFYEKLRDSVTLEGEHDQQILSFKGLHILWVDKKNSGDILIKSMTDQWNVRMTHHSQYMIEYSVPNKRQIYSFIIKNDGSIEPSTKPYGFNKK